MGYKKILVSLFLLAGLAIAQQPAPPISTSQISMPVFTLNVAPVTNATVQTVGSPGRQTIYYWIVSNFPIGASSPQGPFTITTAGDVLSSTNYVKVFPNFTAGVTSIDLLKTLTPVQPSGACNCAVSTGVTSGSISDQSNSTSSYTVNPVVISNYTMTLTNEVQGAGSSHLILRQNGVFVADLSVSTSGVTGATPNGGLVETGTTLGLLLTCSSTQVLAWNGTAWACANAGTGTVTGSGTAGLIPAWSTSTALGNSDISYAAGTPITYSTGGVWTFNPNYTLAGGTGYTGQDFSDTYAFTGSTGSSATGVVVQITDATNNGSFPLGTETGLSLTVLGASHAQASIGTIQGAAITVTASGQTPTTNEYGFKMSVGSGTGTGTTVSKNAVLDIQDKVSASNTITNDYGLYVESPFFNAGGTLSNHYGIYLADQTVSGLGVNSNPYAIYSAGSAQSVFGGIVTAAGFTDSGITGVIQCAQFNAVGVLGGTGTACGSGSGSGTVTNVATGTGLTGGPITTTGTISLVVPVTVADGGTGATSLTGVLKGNGTSAFTAAAASDIVALFSGCSGTQYLGADGACHTGGGGSGTVTSISAGTGITLSPSPITTTGSVAVTIPVASESSGYPIVGDATASQVLGSPLWLDVSKFCTGGFTSGNCVTNTIADAIEAAIASPLNVSGLLDACAFSGNLLVEPSVYTTMLYGGAAPGSVVPDQLKICNVTIALDGPSAGYFTDGASPTPSKYGTPAVIVPSGFKIKGIDRLKSVFLACAASGKPSGCTHGFPQRSFTIASTSVTGNTMTVTQSGTTFVGSGGLSGGQNIWPTSGGVAGELAYIVGSSCTDNNIVRVVKTVPSTSTITITVPTGTSSCASSAGTLYLGTPVFGFGTATANNPYTPIPTGAVQSSGSRLEDIGILGEDNQTTVPQGLEAIQNINGGELTLVNNITCEWVAGGCIDVRSGASDSGPFTNIVSTQLTSTAAGGATYAVYSGIPNRGFENITAIESYTSTNQPSACYIADGPGTTPTSQTKFADLHGEGCTDMVQLADNFSVRAIEILGIIGQPSGDAGTSLIHVPCSGNTVQGSRFGTLNQQPSGSTNAVNDCPNSVTVTDAALAEYKTDVNGAPITTAVAGTGLTGATDITGALVQTAVVNAITGFQINSAAPSNHFPCGNGTDYVDSSAASCGGIVNSTTMTSGYIPMATGANSIGNSNPILDDGITTSNTLSYAGTGGIAATAGPVASTGPTGAAGLFYLAGNTTNPTLTSYSNVVGLIGPNTASFTKYFLQFPSTGPPGPGSVFGCGGITGSISPCNFSETPTLGASGTPGSLSMGNNTSGTLTLQPATGVALGTSTAVFPGNTGQVAELNLAQTWTALQTFGSNASIAATAHGVLVSENTSAAVALSVGATNTVLNGNTGADPSFGALPIAALAAQAADTAIINMTAGSAVPTAVAIPTTAHGVWLGEGTTTAPGITAAGASGTVLQGAGSSTDPSFTATPILGASGTLGSLAFGNATSGTITLEPVTGALGAGTDYLPVPVNSPATLVQTIASGTAAMGTSSISSGTCASAVTVAATNAATTDTIIATPNADPTGVTGYAPSASGSLYIQAYPTAGDVNFKVCNNTSGAITPAALTLNWRVVR